MNTAYRQSLSLPMSLFFAIYSLRLLSLTPTTLSHTSTSSTLSLSLSLPLACFLLRHALMLLRHALVLPRSHVAQVNLKRLVKVPHPHPSPVLGSAFWD